MKFIIFDELRELINFEKDATTHALDKGWDPETTLALYTPLLTEEQRAEADPQLFIFCIPGQFAGAVALSG